MKPLNENILYINNDNIPFAIKIVATNEKYGLNDSLTHLGTEPLVEFYDQRYLHTQLGQFVTRYDSSTLLETKNSTGLNLDGGEKDWTLNAKNMNIVKEWLSTHPLVQVVEENKVTSQKLKM